MTNDYAWILLEKLSDKYYELLNEVATKTPGETRHETAKRYIREAEQTRTEPASEQEKN